MIPDTLTTMTKRLIFIVALANFAVGSAIVLVSNPASARARAAQLSSRATATIYNPQRLSARNANYLTSSHNTLRNANIRVTPCCRTNNYLITPIRNRQIDAIRRPSLSVPSPSKPFIRQTITEADRRFYSYMAERQKWQKFKEKLAKSYNKGYLSFNLRSR